jgi:hypothetical protein
VTPRRQPRDAAGPASAGTCLSCGRTLLASDHFCGGCGTPVPAPPRQAELERTTEPPPAPSPKPEILGLWHEPEVRSPGLRRALWAGGILFLAAAVYAVLPGSSSDFVPITEVPKAPTESPTPTTFSAGDSAGGTGSARPGGPEVASLEMAPGQARIGPGGTVRLKVLATSKGGTVVTGQDVEWRSDAPNVAAVSRNGVVTGVTPGGAIVTATTDGRSASAMVTVVGRGAAALVVQPGNVNIAVNQTARLNAIIREETGNVRPSRGVEWSTSAPGVASVSQTGVVTGLAPGTARIAATGEGLSGMPATVTVTGAVAVMRPPVAARVPAPVAPAKVTVRAPLAPGILQMLVMPWAFVSIDGHAAVHRARGVDTLSAGVRHRLRFERPGFVTFDTTVTLQAGEQKVLEIQLTPRKS